MKKRPVSVNRGRLLKEEEVWVAFEIIGIVPGEIACNDLESSLY